ncbi:MAG: hypothetical protein AAGI23_15800 [Bacteroidota bacterium]
MRKLQFALFLLVPIVNFGVQFFADSPFSDDPENFIQPAGYAFSIWGPIFLGMIIYSWFQMKDERIESESLRKATIAGILAALASITFVPISYTDIQWLSLFNLLWHLSALIWLFVNLRKQIQLESNPNTKWYYLPTQMYLGWISAATAIGFALVIKDTSLVLSESTELLITAVVIAVLALVALLMISKNGGVSAIVIIWALIGVIVANSEYDVVKYSATAAIAVIAIGLVVAVRRKRALIYGE